MDSAFLIGVSQYPNHPLKGVSNDLALVAAGLRHQGYRPDTIHMYDNTHATRSDLEALLAQIQARYASVTTGSCYVHVSARGAFQYDPLEGGILPIDGDAMHFATALSFATVNAYLPVRPGVRVTVTLDL